MSTAMNRIAKANASLVPSDHRHCCRLAKFVPSTTTPGRIYDEVKYAGLRWSVRVSTCVKRGSGLTFAPTCTSSLRNTMASATLTLCDYYWSPHIQDGISMTETTYVLLLFHSMACVVAPSFLQKFWPRCDSDLFEIVVSSCVLAVKLVHPFLNRFAIGEHSGGAGSMRV